MAQEVRLSNGLTVILEPMREAPVVAVQAWVNVGSADESEDFFGAAHLHEHMLFKGTAHRGVGEIARFVESSGGAINAWTSFDQTAYHVVMAADQLGSAVEVLADMLRYASFDADELAREIEVVVEEIHRAQDSPSRRMSNGLFALAYGVHPYGRTVLGTEEDVRHLTRDKLLAFYRRHYGPQNTTLVLTGDFSVDDAVRVVGEHFGDWPSGAGPTQTRQAEPAQDQTRVQIMAEEVPQTRLGVAWTIPPQAHPDIAAIDVLSIVLSHGDAGRLWRRLHRSEQLFTDVYAYGYAPRDPGLFMVGGGVRDEVVAGEALQRLMEVLLELATRPPQEEELERARRLLLSEAAYQRETVQGMARKLGHYQTVAGGLSAEASYCEALRRLVPADVAEVVQRYLTRPPTIMVQMAKQQLAEVDEEDMRRRAEAAIAVGRVQVEGPDAPVPGAERRPSKAGPGGRSLADVVEERLACGALVLFKPETGPVTSLRAAAVGGQRYEPESTAGHQQLMMSLLGQATETRSAEEFSHAVSMLGGTIGAFCGRNSVGLRGDFVGDHALAGTRLFAEALAQPRFDDNDVERERVSFLKRLDRRHDHGASVAIDGFLAAVFPQHPFGRCPLGTHESLMRLHAARARELIGGLLHPRNLVIAVAGARLDQRPALLEQLEEGLSCATGKPLTLIDPERDDVPRAQTFHHALDKEQSHLVVGSMGTTVMDDQRNALEIMCAILSGQGGRLFSDLRDRRSLAYSVSCANLEAADPGYVLVHMGTSPEKMAEAQDGIRRHLDTLRREPVSADELERSKRYLIGTHAVDLQRAGARAMLMALGETLGLGFAHYTYYSARVARVDVDAVHQVAQRFLAEDRLVEVVAGPP